MHRKYMFCVQQPTVQRLNVQEAKIKLRAAVKYYKNKIQITTSALLYELYTSRDGH